MRVASRAALTSWPMASVIETCSVSRSSAKSKVSPPTSPAGSSQPASVNWPASHVYALGSRRCWISAASERGTERCPHSKTSVNRRLAMTTYAKRVGGGRDLVQHVLVRRVVEDQFEHADGFAAVGHRREHAGPVHAVFDLDRLRGECAAVRASRQGHALGGLVP